MDEGYKLHEIDEMDIMYYLRLLNRKKAGKQQKEVYIDELGLF